MINVRINCSTISNRSCWTYAAKILIDDLLKREEDITITYMSKHTMKIVAHKSTVWPSRHIATEQYMRFVLCVLCMCEKEDTYIAWSISANNFCYEKYDKSQIRDDRWSGACRMSSNVQNEWTRATKHYLHHRVLNFIDFLSASAALSAVMPHIVDRVELVKLHNLLLLLWQRLAHSTVAVHTWNTLFSIEMYRTKKKNVGPRNSLALK